MTSATFITFGAAHQHYYEAIQRLTNQANNIKLFDNIIGYTDNSLKNDNDFWPRHENFINNNKRGYGYWLWKPYLIKKTMEKMKEGEILLYLDAGCEIDNRKRDTLIKYFEYVKQDYIINSLTTFNEKEWNKMDLILKLDILDDGLLNQTHRQAGALLIFVCDKTRELINDWYAIGCDYHNIDDTPSLNKNFSCFKEHRHDQSIFSLLLKKNKLCSNHSIDNCIVYQRNRTGRSHLH